MLVEFPSVVHCPEEQFRKEKERELTGTYSVSNYNEEDSILPVVIDMEDVIGWDNILMYHNKKVVPVVRAYVLEDEYPSRNLLISHTKFKMIWEKVNKERIYNSQTILEDES